MKLTPSQKKTVRHQFDSFCRKITREESRSYKREQNRRAEHEVTLSELSKEQLERLSVLDEYPSEQYQFNVQGYPVSIKNDNLASALAGLSVEKREILLLAYFLDMNDREIAETMNSLRCTVQRRRTSSLKEIKGRMEVKGNGNGNHNE